MIIYFGWVKTGESYCGLYVVVQSRTEIHVACNLPTGR